jgi:hypothetical protein
MKEQDWLAEQFESKRGHLGAVAYRMLGSEAEDAVQETWLRLSRSGEGRARAARLALINGAVGAAWVAGGQPRVIFVFAIKGGRTVSIDLLADPERLLQSDLKLLEG